MEKREASGDRERRGRAPPARELHREQRAAKEEGRLHPRGEHPERLERRQGRRHEDRREDRTRDAPREAVPERGRRGQGEDADPVCERGDRSTRQPVERREKDREERRGRPEHPLAGVVDEAGALREVPRVAKRDVGVVDDPRPVPEDDGAKGSGERERDRELGRPERGRGRSGRREAGVSVSGNDDPS